MLYWCTLYQVSVLCEIEECKRLCMLYGCTLYQVSVLCEIEECKRLVHAIWVYTVSSVSIV